MLYVYMQKMHFVEEEKKYSCNYTFIELFKNQFIEQPRVHLTFLYGLLSHPYECLAQSGGCESQGNYPISHNIRIILKDSMTRKEQP